MKKDEKTAGQSEQAEPNETSAPESESDNNPSAEASENGQKPDDAELSDKTEADGDERGSDLEPVQEQESETADQPEPAERKGSSVVPTLISLLALLLVIGGLAAGYYFWQKMNQEFQQMSSQIVTAEKRQNELQTKLTEGQRQLEQQTQQIEIQRKSLAEFQAKLEREQKALKQRGDDIQTIYAAVEKQLGANTGHWRVAEAEHLMRIAQQSLTLSQDVDAALAALKAADQRLRETNDPSWQRVREHLSDEIAQLNAIAKPDIAGLSATLDSLIESVDSLPLKGGITATEAPGRIDLEHGAEASVTRLLSSAWEGLKSMLVVRYHDRPVEAMLPPDRRFFIMENLRLKLEATKIALLQQNIDLYRSNLKLVISWIDGHYDKEDEAVKSFLSRLFELDAANIAPELPDISTSLRSLQERRDIISRREDAS